MFGHLLGTSEPGGYVNGDGLNSHVEKYMIDFLGLKELKNQLNLIIQDYHGSKFKTSDLFKIIKKMKWIGQLKEWGLEWSPELFFTHIDKLIVNIIKSISP